MPRLAYTSNRSMSLNYNKFISGSGVGSVNTSVRRSLARRASNNANGKPCCIVPGNPNDRKIPHVFPITVSYDLVRVYFTIDGTAFTSYQGETYSTRESVLKQMLATAFGVTKSDITIISWEEESLNINFKIVHSDYSSVITSPTSSTMASAFITALNSQTSPTTAWTTSQVTVGIVYTWVDGVLDPLPEPEPEPMPEPEPEPEPQPEPMFIYRYQLVNAVYDWLNNNSDAIATYGYIWNWDVSLIQDFSALFSSAVYPTHATSFNDNISTWDTSNATDMSTMFYGCTDFNNDISSWDVSKVVTMQQMFDECQSFNQDIGSWNTTNCHNMNSLFRIANPNVGVFNQDIGSWNVSNCTDLSNMFYNQTSYNGNLETWTVDKVIIMEGMFYRTIYYQNMAGWNTSQCTNMQEMFAYDASFNQDISGWDVCNVTNFTGMFTDASLFSQDLSSWCVSQITSSDQYTEFSTGAGSMTDPNWPV
jgi:surface protein